MASCVWKEIDGKTGVEMWLQAQCNIKAHDASGIQVQDSMFLCSLYPTYKLLFVNLCQYLEHEIFERFDDVWVEEDDQICEASAEKVESTDCR
eukprot:3492646-Rhodomonas_salina.3